MVQSTSSASRSQPLWPPETAFLHASTRAATPQRLIDLLGPPRIGRMLLRGSLDRTAARPLRAVRIHASASLPGTGGRSFSPRPAKDRLRAARNSPKPARGCQTPAAVRARMLLSWQRRVSRIPVQPAFCNSRNRRIIEGIGRKSRWHVVRGRRPPGRGDTRPRFRVGEFHERNFLLGSCPCTSDCSFR